MIKEDKPGGETFKKRGRPRIRRRMGEHGPWRCYAPQCGVGEEAGFVTLLPEEIELLRLIDLDGLDQEEAGVILGVSRRTVWKDIHEARMKVTGALVHGKNIVVKDCVLRDSGSCPQENGEICPKDVGVHCVRKEMDP